jgi:hypothetical protein
VTVLRLLPLFLLVTLTSCGGARRPGSTADREPAVIEVDNRGFPDMNIYAIDAGQRIRLGTATGSTRTKLTIPARLIGLGRELQFLADPIGSNRTAISDALFVRPGETVVLMIPPG